MTTAKTEDMLGTVHPDNMSEEDRAEMRSIAAGKSDDSENEESEDKELEASEDADADADAEGEGEGESESEGDAAKPETNNDEGKKSVPKIPKARLDESLRKSNELKEANAHMSEKLSLLESIVKSAGTAPETDRDFDAEAAALQKQYDDGDIDAGELFAKGREINKAEAAHIAKVEEYNDRINRAAEASKNDWNTAALAWESRNESFMADEGRKAAMHATIASIDAQTGGKLTPTELLSRAEKIAFMVAEGDGWENPNKEKEQPNDKVRQEREKQAAIRAAQASMSPDVKSTGSSTRVTDTADVLFNEQSSYDDYAKLTKEQKKAILEGKS